jgi:hypothetical protein
MPWDLRFSTPRSREGEIPLKVEVIEGILKFKDLKYLLFGLNILAQGLDLWDACMKEA